MKGKSFLILIIIFLLVNNIFVLVRFYKLKQLKVIRETISYNQGNTIIDELNIYKANFAINILNSNLQLDNITVRDSLHTTLPVKNIFESEQKQMLVFRFSQMHCASCVNASIQILLKYLDSIGMKNVVFLGNQRNNRIFNKTISLYGIQDMKVYNSSKINIPVESLSYPYFFVLDSNMNISNVFVPDKGYPEITNKYLESIQNKFKPD